MRRQDKFKQRARGWGSDVVTPYEEWLLTCVPFGNTVYEPDTYMSAEVTLVGEELTPDRRIDYQLVMAKTLTLSPDYMVAAYKWCVDREFRVFVTEHYSLNPYSSITLFTFASDIPDAHKIEFKLRWA